MRPGEETPSSGRAGHLTLASTLPVLRLVAAGLLRINADQALGENKLRKTKPNRHSHKPYGSRDLLGLGVSRVEKNEANCRGSFLSARASSASLRHETLGRPMTSSRWSETTDSPKQTHLEIVDREPWTVDAKRQADYSVL